MGLDFVETVLWAEKQFDISLPTELLYDADTVGKFVFVVYDVRKEKYPDEAISFDEIYFSVREFIFHQFDIPWAKIDVNSHFVNDLGMG